MKDKVPHLLQLFKRELNVKPLSFEAQLCLQWWNITESIQKLPNKLNNAQVNYYSVYLIPVKQRQL